MYNVSEAFFTATTQPIQRHFLRGTVNGTDFAQSDVVAKSFRITNQLCESSKVILGGVYIGKLEMTFATSYAQTVVARGGWQGAIIVPELGIQLADSSIEYLPAPAYCYTVQEAKWTEKGLQVIAYDNLSKFDRTLTLRESTGTVYNFLTFCCSRCGVPLGMTQAECEALTNGLYTFGLYPTDTVETYRDLLAWLAQACACFVLIGRDGALYLKELPAPVEVATIDTSKRFTGASFSDFETFYTGLSVVNIEANTTTYYNVAPDNGLVMNLGANPFLQYGVDSVKNEIRQAIINKLAQFRATPFSAAMLTNPAYDLGDCLKFSGGIANGDYCAIMQYTLDIDKLSVNGFGENPALMSAQSKVDKDINGLKGQNKENRITYYTYQNVAPVAFDTGDDPTQVCNLRFATVNTTTVTLWQEYKLDVALDDPSTPATVTAHYYIDGIEEAYEPAHTYGEDGDHILGLQYYIQDVQGGQAHTFLVTLEVVGGSVDIAAGDIHVCLSGQGLVGSDSFGGVIEASDNIPLFVVAGIACGTFSDSYTVGLINNTTNEVGDNIAPYPVGGSLVYAYIQDETGDTITDETGDPLEDEQPTHSSAVQVAPLTDTAVLVLRIIDDYAAYTGEGYYCGEDMSTGLYNTLYDGGS